MTEPVYKRHWFWIIAVAVLVIVGFGSWLFITGRWLLQPRSAGPPLPSMGLVDREAVSTEWVQLHFADSRSGELRSEPRQVIALSDPADRVRVIIEELLAGPRGGLTSTLPPTARLREVFLDSDRGLYLDFSSEFVSDQPVGTSAEIAAIGSIMKTVAGNVPNIVRVQILVDGAEIKTVNGHLKADKPFLVSQWN